MDFTIAEERVREYNDGLVIVGYHQEKDRYSVWFVGFDDSEEFLSYGFTWLDRIIDKGLADSRTAVQSKGECLYCDAQDSSTEGVYTLMYYPAEVSMVLDGKKRNNYTVAQMLRGEEDVEFDERVWGVTTPRMRHEEMVVRFICSDCYADVLEDIKDMARDISDDFVASVI